MSTSRTSRNWIADAMKQLWYELLVYGHTVFGITFRPRRFMLAWMRGETRAMNPLGFLAATLAALGFCDGLFAFVGTATTGTGSRPNLFYDVAEWAAPFLYYILLGLFVFLVLRLFRSGARALDALAVALYAGGGPAALGGLALKSVFLVYAAISRQTSFQKTMQSPRWAMMWFLLPLALPYVAYCISLGAGMRAISDARIRAWHVLPAVLLSAVVAGFAFGTFAPSGEYGYHPIFTFTPDPDGRYTLNIAFTS
jgi:hypothetical protein